MGKGRGARTAKQSDNGKNEKQTLTRQQTKKDLQEICDEVNTLLAPHMQLINKDEADVMGSELMAKMVDSPQQIQKKTKQISIVQAPPPKGFHLDIQLFNLKYEERALKDILMQLKDRERQLTQEREILLRMQKQQQVEYVSGPL
ncbi:hypothetical protein WR25_17658 [Diploscapter pachys]|uniref:Uncharacterized protein n=1 Tax=Diploscapter pachys TaxID=2018661 RepID=A0A2A2KWN9_9BILA|nr:hypothetical protein WR25_17658 [Diploscapter pachys]